MDDNDSGLLKGSTQFLSVVFSSFFQLKTLYEELSCGARAVGARLGSLGNCDTGQPGASPKNDKQ